MPRNHLVFGDIATCAGARCESGCDSHQCNQTNHGSVREELSAGVIAVVRGGAHPRGYLSETMRLFWSVLLILGALVALTQSHIWAATATERVTYPSDGTITHFERGKVPPGFEEPDPATIILAEAFVIGTQRHPKRPRSIGRRRRRLQRRRRAPAPVSDVPVDNPIPNRYCAAFRWLPCLA
jgi:hypothetical protein